METIIYFPLRLLTFAIGLFLYWMEIASDWVIGVRSKTEYVRTGLCNRCGRCCRLLALEMPLFISRHDFLVRIISWWHRLCFNFNYEGNNGRWLVYRCGYLTDRCNAPISHPERSEGSHSDHGILHFVQNDKRSDVAVQQWTYCSIYHFRHRLCRFYPRQRLYGHPKTHPDCGFRFVRRDGKPTFDDILKEKRNEIASCRKAGRQIP